MSKARKQNDRQSDAKGEKPTRSFDSSVLGPGTQIGPFRIEQELGRGAVGIVYLAHDTKLDRCVAIKSMPTTEDAATANGFEVSQSLYSLLNTKGKSVPWIKSTSIIYLVKEAHHENTKRHNSEAASYDNNTSRGPIWPRLAQS